MQDLTFVLGSNRTGSEIWQLLGAADVNVAAGCMFPRLEGRVVHVAVAEEDADVAQKTLTDAGFIPMDRRTVIIAEFLDQPGGLGELTRRINDAGATIHIMYMATGNRVVIGASDLDKVASLL